MGYEIYKILVGYEIFFWIRIWGAKFLKNIVNSKLHQYLVLKLTSS